MRHCCCILYVHATNERKKSTNVTFMFPFIHRYLKPLDLSDDQKKNMHRGLVELRNNVCLGMAMINILWIAINFMFQLSSPTKIRVRLTVSYVT